MWAIGPSNLRHKKRWGMALRRPEKLQKVIEMFSVGCSF